MLFSALSFAFFAFALADVYKFPIGYRPNLKQRLVSEDIFKLASHVRQRESDVAKRSVLATAGTPVIDYEDMAYMIQITLGTPAQTFVVFLDSGSANLWVPDITCAGGKDNTCGTYCKSVPYDSCITFCDDSCCTKTANVLATHDACQSKHRFNSSLSSTYVNDGTQFDITYQTGDVKGFFGKDTFCFLNTSVCATGQVFGQATSLGSDFGKQPEDGIIGLGWPALAYNSVTPPLFNLLSQGKLDQPYFVVHLASIGPTSNVNGGTFTVGGLDTVNCDSNVNWIPLTSNTFWQFKLSGIAAGTYSAAPTSGWQAASDTAATFIGGPKSYVEQLAKAAGATYYSLLDAFVIDCEATSPDLVFTINGVNYNIPSSSYILSAGPGPCLFSFYTFTSGGFYPSWMLGPPLIRQYCQVHDMQNARIGMAKVLTN